MRSELVNFQAQNMNIDNENIVDIRRPSEWIEFGVLPGSRLITFETSSRKINPMFLEKIKKFFKNDDKIVLMCQTSKRSKLALKFLLNAGFSNVCEIKGGAYYYAKMGAKFMPYSG